MGEAKRRKDSMPEQYGKEEYILPWVPITKTQSQKFVEVTTKVSWYGIGFLIVFWITIRFIGPAFGWWQID